MAATQTSTAQAVGPVQRGAAQRVQRFYNKGSGRMETAQQMHAYHPAGHQPPAHQVSRTTSTTRSSTATSRSAPAFDLLSATPAQIEARAKSLASAEAAAERLPFQQRDTQLGQEQTGAVAGTRTAYAGLGTRIGAQATGQEASAKTANNEAADRLVKAEAANPKATAGMSESERKQAEADRTLLTGLAGTAKTGTEARQEAESNFLKNLQGITALQGQGAAQRVEGAFGREKGENANRQSQAEARASGRTGKYIDALEGEQAKLRIAGAGLGIKEGQLRNAENKTTVTRELGKERNTTQRFSAQSTAAYRQASLAEKTRIDNANIADKTAKIKLAAEKNAKGKPASPTVLKAFSEQLGGAWTTFERLREPNKKGERVNWNEIDQTLAQGAEPGSKVPHLYKGKVVAYSEGKQIKVPKVGDSVIRHAAEQAFRYHNIDTTTLAQLASKGIVFTSAKEAYEVISGRAYTPGENIGGARGVLVGGKQPNRRGGR